MPGTPEEKRLSSRVKFTAPLRFQIRGLPHAANVLCDNVSGTGVGFTNEHYIPRESFLNLELKVLSRILTPIGKVQWVSPLPHSDSYRVGVKFVEMEPEQQKYLSGFIDLQTGKL